MFILKPNPGHLIVFFPFLSSHLNVCWEIWGDAYWVCGPIPTGNSLIVTVAILFAGGIPIKGAVWFRPSKHAIRPWEHLRWALGQPVFPSDDELNDILPF